MISPDAKLTALWLPTNRLVIREMHRRDIKRVEMFLNLMEASGEYIDPPITVKAIEHGYFEIENGHNRFIAALCAGAPVVPCVVIE